MRKPMRNKLRKPDRIWIDGGAHNRWLLARVCALQSKCVVTAHDCGEEATVVFKPRDARRLAKRLLKIADHIDYKARGVFPNA